METQNHILTNLVIKARKGNIDAKSNLYQQFCKAMFNICFRMMGNRSDAEDVLQNAFIAAFKNLHQLKVDVQFGGWLRRIVINECIKYNKKNFYWNELEDVYLEHLSDDSEEWWHQIDMAMVHDQIKTLPDGCRQVFNLYVVEDFSHKQIADNLGISESTSKSQYFRAKQLLKERITKHIHLHG